MGLFHDKPRRISFWSFPSWEVTIPEATLEQELTLLTDKVLRKGEMDDHFVYYVDDMLGPGFVGERERSFYSRINRLVFSFYERSSSPSYRLLLLHPCNLLACLKRDPGLRR